MPLCGPMRTPGRAHTLVGSLVSTRARPGGTACSRSLSGAPTLHARGATGRALPPLPDSHARGATPPIAAPLPGLAQSRCHSPPSPHAPPPPWKGLHPGTYSPSRAPCATRRAQPLSLNAPRGAVHGVARLDASACVGSPPCARGPSVSIEVFHHVVEVVVHLRCGAEGSATAGRSHRERWTLVEVRNDGARVAADDALVGFARRQAPVEDDPELLLGRGGAVDLNLVRCRRRVCRVRRVVWRRRVHEG